MYTTLFCALFDEELKQNVKSLLHHYTKKHILVGFNIKCYVS